MAGVAAVMQLPPAITNSAIVVAVIGFLAIVIRMIGPWRKQLDELEAKLRKELREERTRCEAELRVVRHRERASRQMIYNLLHLFDLPAAKRKVLLAQIRERLTEIEEIEAVETGIVATAGLGMLKEDDA